MSSVNQIQILGNLGGDPVVRSKDGGNSVVTFSVATSEKWKDREGKVRESTDWHDVAVFGSLADICNKYLKKGSRVFVAGKLRYRTWEKDGQNHKGANVHAARVTFLDSAPHGGEVGVEAGAPGEGEDLPF